MFSQNLRRLLYVLLILSITGCATQKIAIENKKKLEPLALFIADNQHVMDRGQAIYEQGWFIANRAKTARRSALNNLFDLDVISFITDHESQNTKKLFPLIHLGDALNNGCEEEWLAFQNTMQKVIKEWFIVPGNHDFYYLGISYPNVSYDYQRMNLESLNSRPGWGLLCTPWSEMDINGAHVSNINIEKAIFDKRDFISAYKKILENRVGATQYKQVITHNGYIENKNGLLKRAFWSLADNNRNDDQKKAQKVWEDFIVQEIRLKDKPVSLILIDTVSSIKKPISTFYLLNKNRFPLYGDLCSKQSEIIDSWLKENKNITSILVGHHSYSNLSKNAQNNLKQWARYGYFDIYISAHTHSGENIQHKNFLEVNIGSIVDAPIEYMTLVRNNTNKNKHFEIHHNFLTKRTTKLMQKRLIKLTDFSWSDKSYLCSDEEISKMKIFKNRSFREFTNILHRNSRKGQKNSLLKEIETYLKIIAMRQELFTEKPEKDITPICYRTYRLGCKQSEGKNEKCLNKVQLETTCGADSDNSIINKRALKSFADIEKALEENKKYLQEAIKNNKFFNFRVIEASRLLNAIDKFMDKNAIIISDLYYNHIKACLSIVASELKENKD